LTFGFIREILGSTLEVGVEYTTVAIDLGRGATDGQRAVKYLTLCAPHRPFDRRSSDITAGKHANVARAPSEQSRREGRGRGRDRERRGWYSESLYGRQLRTALTAVPDEHHALPTTQPTAECTRQAINVQCAPTHHHQSIFILTL